MKYIVVLSALFFSIGLQAQKCDTDSLLKLPGTLKTDAPYNSKKLSAVDLAKHKKVLATISEMIQSKYKPMGVKAIFHLNYGYPVNGRPAYDYGYSIIPLNFYCDGNILKTAHETSTYFEIVANGFESEIYDTAQGDRLLAEGFNVMHQLPVDVGSYWQFKETDAGLGFGMTGKSTGWLVTYDGKLPYAYVTKLEFLEKRRRSLLVQKNMSAAGFKETLKQLETEKGLMEVEYKNDPERFKKYLSTFTATKIRYEKLLSENERKYQSAFDKIDSQLKKPADELQQQAIVKQDPNDYLSYLFTDKNDRFSEILIKPNPGYFDKKIAKSFPQFFWVYLRWNHNEPIATKFKEDIMKAVDFTTLKNMLGK
ncbi:MAG: hypothetical protein ACOYLO_12680 [Ferruginibacter sp.]